MKLEIFGVEGLPDIEEGDDLAAMILERAPLRDGDVVVVAQKVVSKAEGRLVAVDPARRDDERVRVVESETAQVVARRGEVVIVRTRHGFVCANAGVDASNIAPDRLALLPVDPDLSAKRIREAIAAAGVQVGVIVSDTFGRAWRTGQTNVALGVSGIAPLRDHRGEKDSYGMTLEATVIAIADELAGAAELVMGKSDGVPVAIVRGLDAPRDEAADGRALLRAPDEDLFLVGALEAVEAAGSAAAFTHGDVSAQALVRALEAAAVAAPSFRAIWLRSDQARARFLEATGLPDPGGALIAAVLPSASGDPERALVEAGGAVRSFMIALGAQGVSSRWPALGPPARAAAAQALGLEPDERVIGCVAAGSAEGPATPSPGTDAAQFLDER